MGFCSFPGGRSLKSLPAGDRRRKSSARAKAGHSTAFMANGHPLHQEGVAYVLIGLLDCHIRGFPPLSVATTPGSMWDEVFYE